MKHKTIESNGRFISREKDCRLILYVLEQKHFLRRRLGLIKNFKYMKIEKHRH